MEQLNRVELKGVVGAIRIQTFDETKMARISVATNYAYKDRDGAMVIDTSWHCVVAWEGEKIRDLDKITKGSKIRVLGRLRYQNYVGTDGVERMGVDILASEVELLEDDKMTYQM